MKAMARSEILDFDVELLDSLQKATILCFVVLLLQVLGRIKHSLPEEGESSTQGVFPKKIIFFFFRSRFLLPPPSASDQLLRRPRHEWRTQARSTRCAFLSFLLTMMRVDISFLFFPLSFCFVFLVVYQFSSSPMPSFHSFLYYNCVQRSLARDSLPLIQKQPNLATSSSTSRKERSSASSCPR